MQPKKQPFGRGLPAAAIAALATAAVLSGDVPILQAGAGIGYFWYTAWCIGARAVPHARRLLSWSTGFLLLLSYFCITGFIVFFLVPITPFVVWLIAVAAGVVCIGANAPSLPGWHRERAFRGSALIILLRCFSLALPLVLLAGIVQHATVRSVTTPWAAFPPIFFTLFFLSVLVLAALALADRAPGWFLALPLSASALLVAAIVFPLGFGFDPFIHQATERMLIETGTIAPKPIVYAAYYMLIYAGQMLLPVLYDTLDRFIVPLLATLLIPTVLFSVLRVIFPEHRYAFLGVITLATVPYAFLIQSTPQAFSFLMILLLVIVGMLAAHSRVMSNWILWAIAAGAFVLHPLTGLFAPLFVACHLFDRATIRPALRRASRIIFWTGALVGPPILLLAAAQRSPELSIAFAPRMPDVTFFLPRFVRFIRIDDFIYLLRGAVPAFMVIIAAIGAVSLRQAGELARYRSFILAAGAAVVQFFVLDALFSFNFATAEERAIFAQRSLILAGIFLVPLYIHGFRAILRHTTQYHLVARLASCIAIAVLATNAWYLSYPRFDAYVHSKGYTASASDLTAIRWIHADAGEIRYLVLANQSVSALAIKELGFMSTPEGSLIYPLPTNAPLHGAFLDAMRPDQNFGEIARRLQKTYRVDRVYVLLNSYWTDAPVLREQHTAAAGGVVWFDDAVSVFMYQ